MVDVQTPTVSQQAAPSASQGGTQQQSQLGQDQVVVPAGLIGGLLGSLGGGALGRVVGKWFGNPGLGSTIGKTAGGALGAIAPFSAGPEASQGQQGDDMVVVPAGFLGDLLSGAAGTIGAGIGQMAGNRQVGQQIGDAAAPFLKLIPWSAGPDGGQTAASAQGQQGEEMVVVPAGFLGNLLSSVAGTVGAGIGQMAGNRQVGQQIGEAASPFLKLIPWSAGPDGGQTAASPQSQQGEEMVVVPAGFLGNLLSSVAGKAGGIVGGWAGNRRAGEQIGGAAAPFLKMIPWSAGPQAASY